MSASLSPIHLLACREALVGDMKERGVKVPVIVYRGQIFDGLHRWRAAKEAAVKCPTLKWDKAEPWLDVQSLNLVRRHVPKDAICAIRLLAAEKFPEVAAPILAISDHHKARSVNGVTFRCRVSTPREHSRYELAALKAGSGPTPYCGLQGDE